MSAKKEDPFEYYEIDANSVGTLWYTGTKTTATVPSSTEGVDIKEVGPFTFAGKDTITSVTISDGVEKLN